MEGISVKEEVRRLVDKLPDNATWDDVVREIHARRASEAGRGDNGLSRRQEAVRRITALREQLFAKYGELPDSVELLREIREGDD